MSLHQDIPDQIPFIHGMFHAFDLLVVFVPFSRQYDDIAGLSVFDGISDGFLAVADLHIFSIRLRHTGLDIIDNILRLLKPGIIRRNDRQIRQPAADLSHLETSLSGTIAAAAKQADQSVGFILPQCG